MRNDEHEPRDGENLTDWINRNRPNTAPEIEGQPTFGPDGFAWRSDGWTVVVEINEAGTLAAHWSAPDGHAFTGYSLDVGGHRTAAVEIEDADPEHVEGWPVAA